MDAEQVSQEFKDLLLQCLPDTVDVDIETFSVQGDIRDVVAGLLRLSVHLYAQIRLIERDIFDE